MLFMFLDFFFQQLLIIVCEEKNRSETEKATQEDDPHTEQIL